MKYISFVRAKDCLATDCLHPQMIVDCWVGVDPDIESLPEEEFKVELAKNADLMREFLQKKDELDKATEAADTAAKLVNKRDQREFELWKQGKALTQRKK